MREDELNDPTERDLARTHRLLGDVQKEMLALKGSPGGEFYILHRAEMEDMVWQLLVQGFDTDYSSFWADPAIAREPTHRSPYLSQKATPAWSEKAAQAAMCGGLIRFRDSEDGEKLGTMDRDSLQRGLDLIAKDYPKHLADILKDNCDAETSDIFFQLSVMGEVVYG
jgi:hypothetical protein